MIDKTIRIKDIADKAGVSSSTVSRVINHPDNVRFETTLKVQRAMSELGIEYDLVNTPTKEKEKQLSDNRSKLIIFNHPVTGNQFFNEIYRGIEASASAHGMSVLSYAGSINNFTLPSFLSILDTANIIGVISACNIDTPILNAITAKVPFVACCEYNTEVPNTYVGVDDRKAAKEATEYIISTGHRKIAFLNSSKRFRYSNHRYEGFCEALSDAGISIPNSWNLNISSLEYDTAHAAIMPILNSETIPNAIFSVSDIYAVAAINAARSLGLKVPRDLVVVGFDDVDAAKMSNPSLTTVSMPRYQIGYSSAEMLYERISNPNEPIRNVLLNTVLIIRESSSSQNSLKGLLIQDSIAR